MKKLMMVLSMVITFSTFALAQRGGGGGDMDPTKRAERMSSKMKEELKLSDDQYAKVLKVYTERMTKAQNERKEMQDKRKELMDERKAEREEVEASLKEILTEEQFEKFKANQKERMNAPRGGDNKPEGKKGRKTRGQ
jgi:Spy/CpxP family protein refolding chaperone